MHIVYLTLSASIVGAGLVMVFQAKRDCTNVGPLFPSSEPFEFVLSISDLQEADVLDELWRDLTAWLCTISGPGLWVFWTGQGAGTDTFLVWEDVVFDAVCPENKGRPASVSFCFLSDSEPPSLCLSLVLPRFDASPGLSTPRKLLLLTAIHNNLLLMHS